MGRITNVTPVTVQATAIRAISVFWADTGITNAPDPDLYDWGVLGVNNSGVAAANIYHVAGDGVTKAWTDTGSTVAGFYGG